MGIANRLYTLSPEAQKMAIECGTDLWVRRKDSKNKNMWGRDQKITPNTLEGDIETIGSEILAGDLTGNKWVYKKTPDKEGDIGPGNQVRQTRHWNGHLIVHKPGGRYGDSPDHKYILVVGVFPRFKVKGWTYGYLAQQERYWGELLKGRPAYNFPQRELFLMESWQNVKTVQAALEEVAL